jgi:polyisoprenoid-binding protein YceI
MTAATQTTTTTTTWDLDPSHSLVEFSAKHMMIATVKGRFAGVRGTITQHGDEMARASVDVEIDTASLDTRDERRDGHLRSADFFDVENFPTITFKSTRVEPLGEDRARLIGDLTIKGVTREVALDVTLNGQGRNPYGKVIAAAEASTSINRKDFGLNWNVALETGGWLVGDSIKIFLELEAFRRD